MEKQIVKWSYWLGMASAGIALVLRVFNLFGIWLPGATAQGRIYWPMSFYKGALLFFLIAIASATNVWSRGQKE